ncbi:MAG: Lrp/AsnC family transcriptional regulator [Deltaproteobacteria bacterium]|nr:Lrp/AsnC family transcriptional regulator [Deltaproteobacteria bacterium]
MKPGDKLDEVDRKILTLLQENGRITNVKLAAQVGLSPPSVLERVRKLEEGGIIQKYVAIVDPVKVGRGMTAFVLVSLSYHSKKNVSKFQREVLRQPEVLECYHLAGEGDFLLKVVERSITAYRDFLVSRLTGMEGVRQVKTMIVFDTLKRETIMTIDDGDEE